MRQDGVVNFEKGQWALITGASSGIGKAFAEASARRGLNLYLVGLEGFVLNRLAEDWRGQYGIQIIPRDLDLTQAKSREEIFRDASARSLKFHFMLNAAGFGYFGPFTEMPPDQIEKMVLLNVLAVAQLSRFFLSQLPEGQKGALVNVASISGFVPYPYAALYSATKSFVNTFTRALWAENRRKEVAIVCLNPGYTKTNFEKVSREPDGIHLFKPETPEGIAEKVLSGLRAGRCGFFTQGTHLLKIWGARLIPPKWFAALIYRLSLKDRSQSEQTVR